MRRCKAKEQFSPWIYRKDNVSVYKFAVFNLDPVNVDQDILVSILEAQVEDGWKNYAKQYSTAVDIKLYPASKINDPDVFNGDRIPLFINTSLSVGLGFHSVQSAGLANTESFLFAGVSIQDLLGFSVPPNFPAWTPWGGVESTYALSLLENGTYAGNPYAFSTPGEFYPFLSSIISHELHEIMTDDVEQNWTLFDNFAPTVANWHYAEFDANGNVTNGTIGPDGYLHIPLFSDVFPQGGLLMTVQESADAVNRGAAAKLDSYLVGKWPMANYVLSSFWKGYYTSPKLAYDHNANTELPLQPFGGLHEEVLFIDVNGSGFTFFMEIDNWGPVTANYNPRNPQNNFPPDYTYVSFPFGLIPLEPAKIKAALRRVHKPK